MKLIGANFYLDFGPSSTTVKETKPIE